MTLGVMIVKIFIINFMIFMKVGAFNEETCQPRPGPENGQVSYTVRGGGLVARFRCQTGYKLNGSPFAICLSGVWRHPVPTCQLEAHLEAGSHRGMSRSPGPHDRSRIRGKEKVENYDLNDAPSGPNLVTEPPKPQKNSKKKGGKKNKGKRKAKHKKGRGTGSDAQSLEKDSEFLSKLDLSCLIGTGGTGFIKAPEAAHAVIKYASKALTLDAGPTRLKPPPSNEEVSFDRDEKPIENAAEAVTDLENQTQRLPYPKSVFFIVSNEFCERFTFYGMRTILSLYLKNKLQFSDTTATVIFHVFIMICYFFPLLGAIVADSWLGKFRTILYLSIVYAIGNIVVSTAAIPISIPAIPFTMLGLVLIALGTGGIKPCVSAFGGDQFVLPQQEDQLEKFFSLFYFAINSGSFVSTFLTPILRETKCFGEDSCYSLAFGVPALLMVLAILIYLAGKSFYKIKQPEGNVVVKVAKCMWYASRKNGPKGDHWLDKAQDRYDKGFINDIKAALRVLTLYIPLPFFWALFDQQGSRWTFQAARMNGEIGNFKIQPDQMQVVNPILILVFIPLFQSGLYPLLAKCNLLKRPLQKLTVGGLLAAAAFGVSALVETQLEPTYPILPKPKEGQIRLYNALPYNLTVKIDELKIDEFKLESLNAWEKLNISVIGTKKIKMEYVEHLETKFEDITVFENKATSYTFMPNKILQIQNENLDKSDNGNPKVMIIYSDPKSFEMKNISLIDKTQEIVFNITEETPYTNFTKVPLSADKYILQVEGTTVLENVELKQGGVYLAIISNDNKYKANLLTITKPNTVHILWLIPQYVIITAGEIMFSITGLEFSFTQAPTTMKSLLQAAWLLTVAIGNLIVVIIAEAKLFQSQTYEFLLFAGLMFLDMLVFAFMAMRYTYVEDLIDQNDTELEENGKNKKHNG